MEDVGREGTGRETQKYTEDHASGTDLDLVARAGRDLNSRPFAQEAAISIHPHRTGETYQRAFDRKITPFQSTRPARGETFKVLGVLAYPLFQSTRPARGETGSRGSLSNLMAISIHSPRTGRDDGCDVQRDLLGISIHSPRTGRDAFAGGADRFLSISIHSPRTGRDCRYAIRLHARAHFNPLAPHGARRQSPRIMIQE